MDVLILGNLGVGKSCLINRFLDGSFKATLPNQFASGFTKTVVQSGDASPIQLRLWDSSGAASPTPSISSSIAFPTSPLDVRQISCALLVASVADRQSFQDIKGWLSNFRSSFGPDVPALLVGTKGDTASATRIVSKDEAKVFAAASNLPYLETSSKSGEGVSEVLSVLRIKCSDYCTDVEAERASSLDQTLKFKVRIGNFHMKAIKSGELLQNPYLRWFFPGICSRVSSGGSSSASGGSTTNSSSSAGGSAAGGSGSSSSSSSSTTSASSPSSSAWVNVGDWNRTKTKKSAPTMAWSEAYEFEYSCLSSELKRDTMRLELWESKVYAADVLAGKIEIDLYAIATGPPRQVVSISSSARGSFDVWMEQVQEPFLTLSQCSLRLDSPPLLASLRLEHAHQRRVGMEGSINLEGLGILRDPEGRGWMDGWSTLQDLSSRNYYAVDDAKGGWGGALPLPAFDSDGEPIFVGDGEEDDFLDASEKSAVESGGQNQQLPPLNLYFGLDVAFSPYCSSTMVPVKHASGGTQIDNATGQASQASWEMPPSENSATSSPIRTSASELLLSNVQLVVRDKDTLRAWATAWIKVKDHCNFDSPRATEFEAVLYLCEDAGSVVTNMRPQEPLSVASSAGGSHGGIIVGTIKGLLQFHNLPTFTQMLLGYNSPIGLKRAAFLTNDIPQKPITLPSHPKIGQLWSELANVAAAGPPLKHYSYSVGAVGAGNQRQSEFPSSIATVPPATASSSTTAVRSSVAMGMPPLGASSLPPSTTSVDALQQQQQQQQQLLATAIPQIFVVMPGTLSSFISHERVPEADSEQRGRRGLSAEATRGGGQRLAEELLARQVLSPSMSHLPSAHLLAQETSYVSALRSTNGIMPAPYECIFDDYHEVMAYSGVANPTLLPPPACPQLPRSVGRKKNSRCVDRFSASLESSAASSSSNSHIPPLDAVHALPHRVVSLPVSSAAPPNMPPSEGSVSALSASSASSSSSSSLTAPSQLVSATFTPMLLEPDTESRILTEAALIPGIRSKSHASSGNAVGRTTTTTSSSSSPATTDATTLVAHWPRAPITFGGPSPTLLGAYATPVIQGLTSSSNLDATSLLPLTLMQILVSKQPNNGPISLIDMEVAQPPATGASAAGRTYSAARSSQSLGSMGSSAIAAALIAANPLVSCYKPYPSNFDALFPPPLPPSANSVVAAPPSALLEHRRQSTGGGVPAELKNATTLAASASALPPSDPSASGGGSTAAAAPPSGNLVPKPPAYPRAASAHIETSLKISPSAASANSAAATALSASSVSVVVSGERVRSTSLDPLSSTPPLSLNLGDAAERRKSAAATSGSYFPASNAFEAGGGGGGGSCSNSSSSSLPPTSGSTSEPRSRKSSSAAASTLPPNPRSHAPTRPPRLQLLRITFSDLSQGSVIGIQFFGTLELGIHHSSVAKALRERGGGIPQPFIPPSILASTKPYNAVVNNVIPTSLAVGILRLGDVLVAVDDEDVAGLPCEEGVATLLAVKKENLAQAKRLDLPHPTGITLTFVSSADLLGGSHNGGFLDGEDARNAPS